ncbi:MAG: hypothetical protein IJB01_10365 [Bacteroidaceae bacterium]|nr:hypothetical protein [Bacteroidaceae bacterium]
MSNEKVNLNINVKNGGSKVGSFVTGGVMGAAVAGGAAYAATGELDGVISEIKDRFNGTDETPEPKPATEEKPVTEDNVVVTEDAEEIEVFPTDDVAVQEEVQPLIEESNIEAADEDVDNLQKLENFINDHNNERLEEIQELEEREALKEEIKEELREEIKAELIEEYGLEEVQADDITGNDNMQVKTATGVNDEMSFGEAFSAARAEVGSGGVFEWNGKLYNTFTAEEWEAMSSEEKSDFQDRVYNNGNDVAEVTSEQEPDIEIDTPEPVAEATPEPEIETEDIVAENVIEPEVDDDIEIEVLGMEHNDTYDIDLGGIMIGDQEVVLVDLDSDGGDFDYAIADTDNDGFISQDEIFDLSDDSLGNMDLYANDNTLEDDIDTMDDVDMDFNA